MEELVAPVQHIRFAMETALSKQLGARPLPFAGMDKSGSPVCELYVQSVCPRGTTCPFRHVRGDKLVVCKHWLRGLCKKGDHCEFLHEYDMEKMPECYFYSRFNACHNKECPFLHIDPESKVRDCPWFDRGFCRHGPTCRHRHVRRLLCPNYLAGFCPAGASCEEGAHPRFELPNPADVIDPRIAAKRIVITCHYCQEAGHKVSQCPKVPPDVKEQHLADLAKGYGGQSQFHPFRQHSQHDERYNNHQRPRRNMEDIVCFKCGEAGHFANRCPKGHLAFLSNQGRK